MKLDKVLAEHRERRKADKLSVLTMITKPVSERHRTARLPAVLSPAANTRRLPQRRLRHHVSRTQYPLPGPPQARLGEQPLTLVMDPSTKRLLHYDENSAGNMALETALFSEHRDVQIRTDLLDCHIDICAPEASARSRALHCKVA